MEIKKVLKKIWHFLWKENSVWSWIVDILLIFLIAKFIFFPLMSLIFATSLPFVIIESNSMHHSGDFESWYAEFGQWYEHEGITKLQMEKWPYSNGLEKGDIMVVFGKTPEEYELGDVIIFKNKFQETPIIHRIIEIEQRNDRYLFSTKGDNNQGQIIYFGFNIEKDIEQENVLGRATFRIPYLGWIKLFFVELFESIF